MCALGVERLSEQVACNKTCAFCEASASAPLERRHPCNNVIDDEKCYRHLVLGENILGTKAGTSRGRGGEADLPNRRPAPDRLNRRSSARVGPNCGLNQVAVAPCNFAGGPH